MPQTETPILRHHLRAASDAPGHRRDIQGLRALAVSLVLLYHLWPNRLTGGFIGVDVFFVISGFLITSHLLRAQPNGLSDLVTFWMRRIRRLLPAALFILVVTLIASRLFAPDSQWKGTAHEAIASALYFENWKLAFDAVDYLAAENVPSPFQHYWSLSVEEQFYVVWPIFILVCVLLARRIARSIGSPQARVAQTTVLAGLVLVTGASLAYAIIATASEPSSAYFVTPTRVWELGIGGVLAAFLIRSGSLDDGLTDVWRMPLWGRSTLAWLGLAAIVWTAFTFTDATPFPSYRALLPVLGTVAVLGAHARMVGSPGPFLAMRPVQYLGDISYSLYLWHWPLIVILPYASGGELGILDKLAILASSVVLAGLTKSFVEDRFRNHRAGVSLATPFRFALAGMAVVVAIGVVQIAEVDHRRAVAQEQVDFALSGNDPCFGAASMAPGNDCPQRNAGAVIPATTQAASDKSDAYDHDCRVYRSNELLRCSYGDKDGDVTIALVGNSHAVQWLPALDVLAAKNNWKIVTFLASECYATTIELRLPTPRFRDDCLGWGRKVLDATSGGKFDLVVTSELSGLRPFNAAGRSKREAVAAGYEEYLRQWVARDTDVLVIRDTAFPGASVGSVPDCVSAHPDDFTACSAPRNKWLRPDPLVDAARAVDSPRVNVADLSDFLCSDVCRPVIGRAMVYFDASHLTATYSRTLAPYLEPFVQKSLVKADG